MSLTELLISVSSSISFKSYISVKFEKKLVKKNSCNFSKVLLRRKDGR